MKIKFSLALLPIALVAFIMVPGDGLEALTAREIIKKVDANQKFSSQKYTVKMTIRNRNKEMVKLFTSYSVDMGERSLITFTNPEDKGTRYLKLKDELWIYFPSADDTMKISGHLLKQGMMGSDISYEDMMQKEELEKSYEYNLLGSEKVQGIDCYVVELKALIGTALYDRQVLYIDKTRYVALKLEMYARGGRLMKTMEQFDFKKIEGRYLPARIVIVDKRKKDTSTTIEFISVQFNVAVPSGTFELRNLRR